MFCEMHVNSWFHISGLRVRGCNLKLDPKEKMASLDTEATLRRGRMRMPHFGLLGLDTVVWLSKVGTRNQVMTQLFTAFTFIEKNVFSTRAETIIAVATSWISWGKNIRERVQTYSYACLKRSKICNLSFSIAMCCSKSRSASWGLGDVGVVTSNLAASQITQIFAWRLTCLNWNFKLSHTSFDCPETIWGNDPCFTSKEEHGTQLSLEKNMKKDNAFLGLSKLFLGAQGHKLNVACNAPP